MMARDFVAVQARFTVMVFLASFLVHAERPKGMLRIKYLRHFVDIQPNIFNRLRKYARAASVKFLPTSSDRIRECLMVVLY